MRRCRHKVVETWRLWRRLLSSESNAERMVMGFGEGIHGALGCSEFINLYEPTRIDGLPSNVCKIGAGHYHSLAVTEDGHVWSWGRNNEAQLGHSLNFPREKWNQPHKVPGLDNVDVVNVGASGVVSAAITGDGALWTWGASKRGQLGHGEGITQSQVPRRVTALCGEKIAKVQFGWGHVLACTVDGRLYGWGYSAEGRLGLITGNEELKTSSFSSKLAANSNHSSESRFQIAEKLVLEELEKEKSMPIIWEPCLVLSLKHKRVIDIACGLDHSLVLSDDGLLYSFGNNTYGQLGKSPKESVRTPLDLKQKVLSTAAGLGHSLAIISDEIQNATEENKANGYNSSSTKGSLLSWGWNSTSQLGRVAPDVTPVPGEVTDMKGKILVSISAGRAHSMAVDYERQVWSWGCGRNGRLGLGSNTDETEPCLLESLTGLKALQAVCGYDHSLLLVEQ